MADLDRTMMQPAQDTVCIPEDEIAADVDEPPDAFNQQTPKPLSLLTANAGSFTKTKTGPSTLQRKESLLTTALQLSASESPSDEEPDLHFSRESSCADLTSDCGFTSSGTRCSSPSPPLAQAFHGLPPIFSKPDFNQTQVAIRTEDDAVDPQLKEAKVEANLGRKRCITFACGRKSTPPPPVKVQTPPKTEQAPVKRCTIRFACPSKVSSENISQDNKPKPTRAASPAPSLIKQRLQSSSPRRHRDSDATLRNESPKAMRKNSPMHHVRKLSSDSDLGKSEATRFHAFASAEAEVDDWTKESTCHRSRLTISDTLKIENGLRKLGEEAEEEAVDEEDDAEEDEDDGDDDDEDLDDEENDTAVDYEDSDDGFHTDNEAGFASSDEDSDADSEFDWWAPGAGAAASTAATSTIDQVEHIRSSARRSFSDSSVGSPESSSAFLSQMRSSPNRLRRRKRRGVDIQTEPTPELPDSTDFVLGTLDEDRPLEDAYCSAIERRRAAKHRATPQDIDPTFPTSDPELSEDEDEAQQDSHVASESDRHMLMHGSLDSIDATSPRHRNNKKAPTPKRMRSPPPVTRRARSPPPPTRRQTASPPKRARSPAPSRRPSLISPPPPRTISNLHFVGLSARPSITIAASLPRAPATHLHSSTLSDSELSNSDTQHSRGAIDIKAGLEQKRQRRLQKLYQKHCRNKAMQADKKPVPGKGCERMREIGLEIAAYNKSKRVPMPMLAREKEGEALVISI